MKTFLRTIIFLLLLGVANAKIINVPSDQPTIQAGIDAAIDGDTVLVAGGTYTGPGNVMITLKKKGIIVKSQNGPSNCIIDSQGTGYFGFGDTWSYEGLNAIIEGFTIRNCAGPGFYFYAGACPAIIENIIEFCGAGGITIRGGSPIIRNNIIQNNEGSGIDCSSNSAQIIANTIRGNRAEKGAGINLYSSSASIINNIISDNHAKTLGGGIYAKKDTSRIIINTIVHNSSRSGAGIYISESNQTLINNIVTFSKRYVALDGNNLEAWRSGNTAVTYSYSGGVLSGAILHVGFVNMGAACNVTITVYGLPDTTIFVQSYERYSMDIECGVKTGSDNLISYVYSDTDTLKIVSSLGVGYSSTRSLTLTSYGTGAPAGGLMAIACDATIIKNCSFYDNDGGGYFTAENDSSEVDLTGIDGNVTSNPLLNENDYSLATGSPCIDKGIPDTSGLNLPAVDINGALRIMDGNDDGVAVIDIGAYEYDNTADVKGNSEVISRFELFQNYPNPFNATTTIKFSIAVNGFVTLDVFDLLGKKITSIVNDVLTRGDYSVEFDGSGLSSGVYFFRLQMNEFVCNKKTLLLK